MADQDKDVQRASTTGAPLQAISWSKKIANNKEWFKQNIDYGISQHGYGQSPTQVNGGQDLDMLYGVYNSKFPESWFKIHTDPLNAKDPKHKQFPAKIRPITILRTNIDLLLAEYPRRPLIFQVNNLGDDAYSSFMEEINKKIETSVTEYFKLALQKEMMASGLMTSDGQPASEEAMAEIQKAMDEFQNPEQIKEELSGSYRDKVAIQAQRWLTRAIREHNIRGKLLEQFKDWLITGRCRSYKGILHGNLVYERISPKNIRSDEAQFIEDAEQTTVVRYLSTAEIVDRFYEELKESEVKDLELKPMYASPQAFHNYLHSFYDNNQRGKVPVYHRQWTGRKRMGLLTRLNPETQVPETIEVDEDYVVSPELGETIEWLWVNEKYEGWRVGKDLYLGMGPVMYQRSQMNNFSYTKGSYNGRNYSDTHAENVSPMELGIPTQIMYLIANRTLELTIAKSKGKIALIDKAAIPRKDGWNDEKFFYYSEALGYALMDFNQLGVNKNFNQYQVLDMTLFDSIKQLIELLEVLKQQWDDILGINRQRKGQTYSSDGQGVNERAVFQSTVITDMIYNLFEEYVEKEFQGLIDLSKFTNMDGVRKLWWSTDVGNEVLEINPESYCNADLGVMVESSSEAMNIKNKLEATALTMLQNEASPSTILEIYQTQNIAELKRKLKDVERIASDVARQGQDNESKMAEEADARQKEFMEYEKLLDKDLMEAEYDRKEDIEDIRGMYSTFTFQDGDSNDNGTPDAMEVERMRFDKEKFMADRQDKQTDRNMKRQEHVEKTNLAIAQMQQKNKQHGEKMKTDRMKAKQRPKTK